MKNRSFEEEKANWSCCASYRPQLSPTSSGPVLVLLDTDKRDLECLLDFMYRGEALVSQERLQSFLNLAEKLQVDGT